MLNSQLVYLAQTDTTAGFLSQNPRALANSKKRDTKQPFIMCVDSLQTLKKFARVPKNLKNEVRRSKKSTFIYPNNVAIRVVQKREHLSFLKKVKWFYSSSANETSKKFDIAYAQQKADIIVQDSRSFFEDTPSKIYKLIRERKRRLR